MGGGQVGLLTPEACPTGQLCTGQVGYIIPGLKSTKAAKIGDTWHHHKQAVQALPGFRPTKAMVFAGVRPPPDSQIRRRMKF